jgi:hypothetical protein
MTDEEMAEEYAEKHSFRVPYDGSNKFYDDTDFKASKDGFLAGLKAGRPQWHDLRKDPNDLPNEGISVLVILENGEPYISGVSTDNRWFCTDYYTGEDKVIKWKEIE